MIWRLVGKLLGFKLVQKTPTRAIVRMPIWCPTSWIDSTLQSIVADFHVRYPEGTITTERGHRLVSVQVDEPGFMK